MLRADLVHHDWAAGNFQFSVSEGALITADMAAPYSSLSGPG